MHPKRVIKSVDFLKDFFAITKSYKEHAIFENASLYKSGYNLDFNKLEEDAITEEKLFEDNNTNQDTIKESATKYKNDKEQEELKKEMEQQKREIAEDDKDEFFTLNGKSLSYGKYHESSSPLYGDLIIHKNGTCEIGGNKCNWVYSNFDFGSGSEQSIDVHKENEVYHFTSRGDNTITNGSSWNATLTN